MARGGGQRRRDDTRVGGADDPRRRARNRQLANLAVDQCELLDERFTLIAPDNYRQDFLEIKLWSGRGQRARSPSRSMSRRSEPGYG